MKILVTGAAGQLGYDCVRRLDALGIPCVGVDKDDFDLTDAKATDDFVRAAAPTHIIHCAAYTAVDRAESEPALAAEINGMGTLNLARAALHVDAAMLYVSTDYVFSGRGDRPWEVTDKPAPASVYGLTKAQGEEAVRGTLRKHFIVRIAWAFGINGHNFVRTMLRLGSERKELTVVSDQFGSPTYTADLAVLLCDMIRTDRYGTYHATNEGFISWAEFAEEIMRQGGKDCRIVPVTSEQYGAPANRPKNSRLSKASLDENGFSRLPPWQDALSRYLRELAERGE